MRLRTISQLRSVKGKRVLLRVDFNVRIGVKGEIDPHDDDRVRASLPTIKKLAEGGARVILISHLGRPEHRERKYSLLPAARILEDLLRRPVFFCGDLLDDGEKVDARVAAMKDGNILVLENLRYYKGEERNDRFFARRLASLADLYVNDAFAVAHRAHASLVGVASLLPSYAGLLMETEVRQLGKLLSGAKRPFVVLVGGAKVSTKLPIIKNLLPRADLILVGGGMANNFFKAMGYRVGRSRTTPSEVRLAKTLLSKRKIVLPYDVLVADRAEPDARVRVAAPDAVRKDEIIVDAGPETVRRFSAFLKQARTLVWNGPLGITEIPKFSHASVMLARVIAARSSGRAFGVVGGGDSLPVLSRTGMGEYVDHVSTGGGAMLDFLAGKILPALEPLMGEADREKGRKRGREKVRRAAIKKKKASAKKKARTTKK